LNSEININKERINNNNSNYDRLKLEIDESKDRIKELEEEKNQKQVKKDNLFSNKEKFSKELEEKETELANLTEKLSSKEIQIEEKKQKVEKNTDEKYEISNVISTLIANMENSEKRENNIKSEITSYISELDSSRIHKEEISKSFYEIDSRRNKIKNELEEIEEKRIEAENKLKDFQTKINNIETDRRIKDSKLKFLEETEKEKEGYTKSIKAILKECEKNQSLNKGNHGVLANLISAPKEYEIAIEMSLGQAMQNIVTDTEEDAKKLVNYLRENKLGRASFLPISSVNGKKLDKFSNDKGVIGIASDLIKFDKKYEQIILNLLGRTLIVDNMDTAIAISKKDKYSFKIVTLEGDIVNPSGMITGGSVIQKTTNILGRSREIEELKKELKVLDSKIDKLKKEKEEYEENIEDTLSIVSSLEKEIQEIEIVYATEKQKVVSEEEAIKKVEDRISKLREEQNTIKEQKDISNKKQEELNNKIKELEEENSKLTDEINEYAILNKDNQKYIDDLKFDITNLKISVSSFDESADSINEMLDRINLDIENTKTIINNKTEQRSTIVDENSELEEKIKKIELEIEKLKQDFSNSGKKVEELKNDRQIKNEKLDEIEENILEQMKKIEELKNQVIKSDVKKAKLESERDQIINKMWEEYELTPGSATEYKKPTNAVEVQKQVNNLRNQIKDLGSINIDAIEEYKKLKERYDFMSEQRLDLEDTMTKLRKVIVELTEVMKEQFREKFRIINKNFSDVFKELFGGGKAELRLTDENDILESGIEIEVQPPGKKLQSMSLLSGGERAFTAIALLFAILKINPAPFCVLDEIEAALDDVNVYRFADYLKKFSSDTQFLVITHRKGTMEVADTVYGITMEENGISKLLSIDLKNKNN
ncbi:MAG: chromosome segregation protein SMC, partial [Clostridia bacterium]|nr:chromosome segregation protein SMC [Clostridia bacterium]